MAETLMITNNGPAIIATNYWTTAAARAGKFYLSTNAGTFRLLVPAQHAGAVRDMRTATLCVVSRGPMMLGEHAVIDALEILFDDGTTDPFSMHLSPGQIDRMPLDIDSAHAWILTVWTHLVGERGRQVLERACRYRRVRRLPDLRPWAC